jgi:hypothetical protein
LPPWPIVSTRWLQGLSRASIRIYSLLLAGRRGKDICRSEKVVQVGGIMAVYGLSLRRLTASQRLSCGCPIIEHVGESRLQRPSVNYEAMCPLRRCVQRKSRVAIVCSVVWSCHYRKSVPGRALNDSGALAWLTPGSRAGYRGCCSGCGSFGINRSGPRGRTSVVPGTRRAFDPDEST